MGQARQTPPMRHLLLCLALLPPAVTGEPTSGGAPDQPPVVIQTTPSPSLAPGIRIWPAPAFTHWPAVVYRDEPRNLAFALPVRQPGVTGTIAWQGGTPLPFTLPDHADRIGGLIDLPAPLLLGSDSERRCIAEVRLAEANADLALRLVASSAPWPHVKLREGFPVDAQDAPVVLVDERFDAALARRWSLAQTPLPRPTGAALIVGDPLEALGRSPWDGLAADRRPATDERYPQHAALVALAVLPVPLPRTIIWCPGNQVVRGGAWSAEEGRLIGALTHRLVALGAKPKLVLALPPDHLESRYQAIQESRRDALVQEAVTYQWTVLDLNRAAGEVAVANRVGEGVFTTYPNGEGQARIHAALAKALE